MAWWFGVGTSWRLRYVHFPLKSKELHLSVVNEVKAKSQLNPKSNRTFIKWNEMDLIRRARNKQRDIQRLKTQTYTLERMSLKPW